MTWAVFKLWLGTPPGRWFLRVAGGLVVMLAIVAGVMLLRAHWMNEGKAKVSADRDRWKATAAQYRASAVGWEKNFRWDARLRDQERVEAITAIKAAGRACDARVEAARKTTTALQSIITRETIYDQAHCPVRRGVGFDSLRDATGLAPVD